MNFLGHACFSPDNPAMLTGNMISDFVKGKSRFDYPKDVQQGIGFHRRIDHYIDHHPAAIAAKEPFRPAFRLYAGALVDVSFDYFIANDPAIFSTEQSLMAFSQQTYTALDAYSFLMPARFAAMFKYMCSQNWLYNYRFLDGMRQSFGGLVRRAAYMTDAEQAFTIFREQESLLRDCYNKFMLDFRPWQQQELTALAA